MIQDMSFDEYRELDAANASGLKLMLRSPAHYKQRLDESAPATPSQHLGTLTHLRVLEPEEYARRVIIEPEVNKRTKAGRQARENFLKALSADAVVASVEQDHVANEIALALMENPYAAALLADGEAEQTATWSRDGYDCKARFDWVCSSHKVIVDLKTAIDASLEGFRRATANFLYHLQAAWYLEGAEQNGLLNHAFVFIVAETSPPYASALYELDPMARHIGRLKFEEAFALYVDCRRSGDFPGYPQPIQNLTLPAWATR